MTAITRQGRDKVSNAGRDTAPFAIQWHDAAGNVRSVTTDAYAFSQSSGVATYAYGAIGDRDLPASTTARR